MNKTAIMTIAICAAITSFLLGTHLRSATPSASAGRVELASLLPNGQTSRPTVAINGSATLDVVPDVLDVAIELGVDRLATSRQAAQQLERRRADLIERLAKIGVKRADTAMSRINVSPIWDHPGRRIVGYSATLSVTASLNNFDLAPAVLDAAAAAGARRLNTSFRSTEMPELKKRVRDMALRAAKDKAAQIKQALDLESLSVMSVNESPTGQGWGYWYQSPWLANAVAVANPAQVATGAFAPEIQPLTLTVNITYAIGR